ncbi:MAG TPA: DUF6325 family protein [Solirubrobacterales bacterium]|nr:DUF6325 family protein [Solirubrobacterales bacterium]
MSAEQLEEIGPIDYVLVEWQDGQPNGAAAPHLIDLVERGIIRILDLAFITKDDQGNVAGMEMSDLAQIEGLDELTGAASGLLSEDDTREAAEALEPGTTAALLVYENSWAAGFATALRENGAQLVASGRIPVQAVIAALDATEDAS